MWSVNFNLKYLNLLPYLIILTLNILYFYFYIKVPKNLLSLFLDITKNRVETIDAVFIDSYKAAKMNYLFMTLYYVQIKTIDGTKDVLISNKQIHLKSDTRVRIDYLKNSKLVVQLNPIKNYKHR
ncbi:hypothetical protein [Ammoniphilus resinae]|uniref:hypothetical protein n=1 Tax=Ammoniphilus resinae TaxID=861532 RepID=UPI001AE35DCC|nr:hypothetical protein [Ammoniphilus resinae]